jgi:hypothetical protein
LVLIVIYDESMSNDLRRTVMKPQQQVPLRMKIIVALLVVFVLAGFVAATMWIYRRQDDQGMAAAAKMAQAVGTTVSETGTKQYPWGVVRVFEGRSAHGNNIVIEVNRNTNLVNFLETLGTDPAKVVINDKDALSAAVRFIKDYAPEVNLDDLRSTISPPTENGTIKDYRIEWQAFAQSGAILPIDIIVYVNGETGQVQNYINNTLPVRVDTTPQLSKEQAMKIIQGKPVNLPKDASFGDPTLMVIQDSRASVGQRLIWEFPISVQYSISDTSDDNGVPQFDTSPPESFAVDAHSGEIVDLNGIPSP